MKNYTLDEKYRYFSRTISKGTQLKYKKGEYYYKINKFGNEGFTEYLVSRLLKNSTLKDYYFVDYEYCMVNNKLGCRSKNFLVTQSEEFISMNSLYSRLTGRTDLADYLLSLNTPLDRLNFLLDIVEKYGFSRKFYYDYMNMLMQLDLIIQNTDRHVHNYGLVYNKVINRFRVPPIFDNGLSLDTDRSGNKTSCTISGSFVEQVVAFGYPIKPCFQIDYSKVKSDLNRIEKTYGKKYEVSILIANLEEYKSLFKMN